MKLKLDENLGTRGAEIPRQAGHDVTTVPQQELYSASDRRLIDVCRQERRCLVTLDLDFANPLMFPPADHAGVAVLRIPSRPARGDLFDAVRILVAGLKGSDITGKLWIVQRGRIRQYQDEATE